MLDVELALLPLHDVHALAQVDGCTGPDQQYLINEECVHQFSNTFCTCYQWATHFKLTWRTYWFPIHKLLGDFPHLSRVLKVSWILFFLYSFSSWCFLLLIVFLNFLYSLQAWASSSVASTPILPTAASLALAFQVSLSCICCLVSSVSQGWKCFLCWKTIQGACSLRTCLNLLVNNYTATSTSAEVYTSDQSISATSARKSSSTKFLYDLLRIVLAASGGALL